MVCPTSITPTGQSQVNDAFCLTSQNHLIKQLFVSGPGFSPVPLKPISQIDTWKYVALSDPLAATMVHLDPKQLLLDGWFVLATPMKKQHWHSEDLTAGQVHWCQPTFFWQQWKDLIPFNLQNFPIHHQFNGEV